ncbi:pantoate--beta-alanine ligase [Vulgatibacter incomptus]|nr:pantoate--beta-alanine ligase [Vulgatibacter incomptus]
MQKPIVVHTREELLKELRALEERGVSLALVPTMGYLHEGHLSLVREGAARADRVAVSIFVNPTQFGPGEDLDRYPRDLSGDVEKLDAAGAWLVYAPKSPREVYPEGFQTWVDVEGLSLGLCGGKRPGHFRGVATVVCKLLTLFRPKVALFGQKDYQQLAVIRRMARDLDLDARTEVVGMPIVREPDGLAMSSRNAYLSADERRRALSLHRGLYAARALHEAGERDPARLIGAARDAMAGDVDRIDYVELVDADSLETVERVEDPVCLLVAAFVGRTRLIDNLVVGR